MIDLTVELNNDTKPYSGDPNLVIEKLDNMGYNISYVHSTMHMGTHIDVRAHFFKDRNIVEYELDNFFLEGVFYNIKEDITVFKDALVIETMKEDLSMDLARLIVSNGVKMLVIDNDSPDKFPFTVHRYLLDKDIIIVENATNLGKLKGIKKFQIMALPLKIQAEASLTRLVAIIGG